MDALSINGVEWHLKCQKQGKYCKGAYLFLQRAGPRYHELSPEQLEEKRKGDKVRDRTRNEKRVAEGLPISRGNSSKKSRAAMGWEVNKLCKQMCKEGQDDLAFDL